jgi:hypothetical protein
MNQTNQVLPADRLPKIPDVQPDDVARFSTSKTNEAATAASLECLRVSPGRQLPALIPSTLLFESHLIDLTCAIQGLHAARRSTRPSHPAKFSM